MPFDVVTLVSFANTDDVVDAQRASVIVTRMGESLDSIMRKNCWTFHYILPISTLTFG